MSSDKESFEDRLRRINAARGQTAAPVLTAPAYKKPPARQRGPSKLWLLGPAVAGVLALTVGAVFMTDMIYQTAQKMGLEVAEPLPGSDSGLSPPSLLNRAVGLLRGSPDDQRRTPLDFLPPAPDGWVRVTSLDAQAQNPLDGIRAQWPQDGALPLEQNAGFEKLQRFLEWGSAPDMEQKALSKTRSLAFYLNPTGEFLTVQLELEPQSRSLGARNDTAGWIEGLVAAEEKQLEAGEILERIVLADLEVTNRTKPTGKSLIARPIGADIYATNGLQIAVPLTHRAVLRIEGISTPIVVATLVAATDRNGLLARLD